MIDVEALKRFLLLSGLLFTAVGWWRAEVHNARLAESAVGFRDLAQTCVDTSFTRLDDLESKRRELVDALSAGGPRSVVEAEEESR